MSFSNCRVVKREELESKDAAFSRLVKATYHDAHNTPRTWEYVERRTRQNAEDNDGVGIIAILRRPWPPNQSTPASNQTTSSPEIVLIKQFRPPVDKVCIETPGGLLDVGETVEQTAVRELREETGYVGVAETRGPNMWSNPGLANASSRMVHVKVDMSLPENQMLVAKNEEDEFIEVFTVPLTDLWQRVIDFDAKGYAIDKAVVMLAEGIELGKRWQL